MDGGFAPASVTRKQSSPSRTRSKMPSRPLRFIDLFAGLGGFHVGMSRQGHQCVFASELDSDLARLYESNFRLPVAGDVRNIREQDIPSHEVLCAGFPCQPFSLAGKRKGDTCPESGKLIDDVFRVIAHHRPDFVLLENVPNILGIANGAFWRHIETGFGQLGYEVTYRIYSPHQFGIPQKRNRIFVVAARDGLGNFMWPEPSARCPGGIDLIVDRTQASVRSLEADKRVVLNHWNLLLPRIAKMTSDTILAEEFGANYPLQGFARRTRAEWSKYQGAFGVSLAPCKTWDEVLANLPNNACRKTGAAAGWLRNSPDRSRAIYEADSRYIDKWKTVLMRVHKSWRKLEWRGYATERDIWQHTIQFRASGIRIMRREFAPSLIAMTPTQTPILGPEKRYMAAREAAALQHLEGLPALPETHAKAFKALGNAVNAFIVSEIAGQLLK